MKFLNKVALLVVFLLTPTIAFGQASKIPIQCADTSGSATAYTCSTILIITPSFKDGIIFTPETNNSGDATITINGGTAYHIKKWLGSSTLASGDLIANKPVFMTFDGSAWETSTIGNAPTGTGLPSSPVINGQYNCGYTVVASAAVSATCPQIGLGGRGLAGSATALTIAFGDNGTRIVHDKAATGTGAITLPTATTLTNPGFVVGYCNFSAQTDVITPTTWTINGNSSLNVSPNVCVGIQVDPNSSTNWIASVPTSGGGGSAFPVTVSGVVNSGGMPYFNSTTQESSSATLTLNALIKGGGTGGAPTSSSITDASGVVSTTEPLSVGASVSTTADGVHPGGMFYNCETTLPGLTANGVTILGCPGATNTAWSFQLPTIIPATGSMLACVTTSTNCLVAPATSATVIGLWTGTCSSSTYLNGAGACTTPSGGSSAFPLTVSGTVNSGGIPYFNSTTQESSSAALTANVLVKGGGAGAAPANSSVTDNGTTVSTTEPLSVGASVSTTSDGTHPSSVQLAGNTTLPTLTSNTVTILGPPSATPTAWSLQVPTALPVTTDFLSCTTSGTNCLLTDTGIPATATGLNTTIKTLTGCNTATYVYTPQASDCVAPSGGGSGTVNSGTTPRLAYYASSSTAVSDTGANLTWSSPTLTIGVAGTQTGSLALASSTSTGSVKLTPASAASAFTMMIPAATDTLVDLAGTQTLTNKSIVATQLTGTLQAGQFPALTGDITTPGASLATTLATVNSNVGSFTNANVTVNAKGLITAVSNGSGGSTANPFTGNRYIWCAPQGSSYGFNSTGADIGCNAQNTGYSMIAATSTTPIFGTVTTAATSGDAEFLALSNSVTFAFGSSSHVNNLYFVTSQQLAQTTTIREWMSVGNNLPSTQAASATPGGSFAGFRYDTGASDTHWTAITCNAGTCTTTSTGVAADTNYHIFQIICNDSVPNIQFVIDGVVKVTTTTNLPPDSTGASPLVSITTLSATAETIDMGGFYLSTVH